MHDNFRPNVRLTTNILMVIGIFSIASNLAPIAKQARIGNICREGITAYTAVGAGLDEDFYTNKLYRLDKKFSKLTNLKKVGTNWSNLRIVCPTYVGGDWNKVDEFYKNLDK